MPEHYQHLGIFSDWVAAARQAQTLYPMATPGPQTQTLIRECLGFCHAAEVPRDVNIEREWEKDGLVGQEISWSVGFGPRTHAYVLKPANANGPLPGIVTLHDHSDLNFMAKKRLLMVRKKLYQSSLISAKFPMVAGPMPMSWPGKDLLCWPMMYFYGEAAVFPWRQCSK